MADPQNVVIKSSLTIQGEKARRIRRLKDIIGLNTDADILQHLINAGLAKEAVLFAAVENGKAMNKEATEAIITQFGTMGEQMRIQLEND